MIFLWFSPKMQKTNKEVKLLFSLIPTDAKYMCWKFYYYPSIFWSAIEVLLLQLVTVHIVWQPSQHRYDTKLELGISHEILQLSWRNFTVRFILCQFSYFNTVLMSENREVYIKGIPQQIDQSTSVIYSCSAEGNRKFLFQTSLLLVFFESAQLLWDIFRVSGVVNCSSLFLTDSVDIAVAVIHSRR